jgi:hypothetical protein
MPTRSYPLTAVAALFLERQHLARPRAAPLTPRRLLRFAEDVGGIQLDSINVLDRAHYLTVWARFGPYDRARLDRLTYGRRLLFEYWAHAACLLPATHLPAWRRLMLEYDPRHTGWHRWLERNAKVLARVRAEIAKNGPMGPGDFAGGRRGGGWWSWGPAHHALHHLWMTGVLTVASRRHFQKRFDLFERAFPDGAVGAPIPSEEFPRWHLRRSLHAMGAATDRNLAWYLSFPRLARGARTQTLRELVARGEVAEIAVEGQTEKWYALAEDLPALRRAARVAEPSRGTTVLAPFDSFMWDRARVKLLFGFEYRIEVYTPGADRVHGYYTVPVLHDGALIGRVDAKTHRAEGKLEVRHASFEPWFAAGKPAPVTGRPTDVAQGLAGLADALRSLAEFVGAREIVLKRATPARLRPALARSLA